MNRNNTISTIKTVITTILLMLANVIAIIFVDYILTDFTLGYWYNSIIIVIAVNIANSILWPIFRRFLMKFIIFTVGLGALLINAIIFYIVAYFIPGFHVGFYAFFIVPIVMAIATTFMTNITNTNYYDVSIKNILKYAMKKKTPYKNGNS